MSTGMTTAAQLTDALEECADPYECWQLFVEFVAEWMEDHSAVHVDALAQAWRKEMTR